MEQNYEREIDLGTLFKILFSRWYLIILLTLMGFGLAYGYAFVLLDNEYTANTSMIVLVSNESQTSEQNFNFSQKLTKTYTELAKSDLVLDQVRSNLNVGVTLSNKDLREMMTITGVDQTPIIKLAVVHHEPLFAQQIANETVRVMQLASFTFEGFDNIELLDPATYPFVPSGPNRLLYLVIGILIGGFLGVGLVFMIEFLDKTIKSPTDIEDRLKQRVLTIIPNYHMEGDFDDEQ